MRRLLDPLVALPAAFVVTTTTFLLATAVSQHWALSIDTPARDISRNAAPSIEHLTTALARLRELQADLARACLGASDGDPAHAVEIARSRRDIEESVHAYLDLPSTFPGERAIWADAERDLAALDLAVEAVAAPLAAGDLVRARAALVGEFEPAADQAAEGLRRTVDLNALALRERAATIEDVRERAAMVVYALDGLGVVVTIFAAMLVGRAVLHARDMQQRSADALRRQVEELEAFSGRVAHDILGPVSGVSMALDLVTRSGDVDGRARVALERARSCVRSIDLVVHDLLEFARAGARPAVGAEADVDATTAEVVATLHEEATAARVRLERQLDHVPPVACAPGVLVSLVSNLVRNAIKFMGDTPVRRVVIRAHERRGVVRVEVADTGPGVPAELLPVLFQPHVRGRSPGRPGLGLGLATVRRLAEAHGGRVGVDTDLGRGSTFWCELPKAERGALALATGRRLDAPRF